MTNIKTSYGDKMEAEGYIQSALILLDQAFDKPVYISEHSESKFHKQTLYYLIDSYRFLKLFQLKYGENALCNYLIGIIFKYFIYFGLDRVQSSEFYNFLGIFPDKIDFLQQINKALICDPEFLEAQIALREKDEYLDPFCYPKFEDLCNNRISFRPAILGMQDKTARLELVRDGWRIIPAVIIKRSDGVFRSRIDNDSEARVLLNIETVLATSPVFPAFLHVVPVIFDDIDDPFWCSIYVNLYPVKHEIYGIPMMVEDYQPWLGRYEAQRFCQKPCRCGFFVLNMQNQLLMAKMINFNESETERLSEFRNILYLLDEKERDYIIWKMTTDIHNDLFSRELINSAGTMIRIPKWRAPNELGRKMISPIVRNGDQLLLSELDKVADVSRYRRHHNVFIIHAHSDSKWAEKINIWLNKLWPFLQVYRTEPTDVRTEPFYFLMEIKRSDCVIYLVTPRSLERPMTEAELGAAAAKPIISILAGGITVKDIEEKKARHKPYDYINLKLAGSTDNQAGWEHIAQLLSEELKLTLPQKIPDGPRFDPSETVESKIKDPLQRFLNTYQEFIKNNLLGKQMEYQAESLIELIEKELIKKEDWPADSFHSQLRFRLLLIALCIPEENIKQFLEYFPALVDEKFLEEITRMQSFLSEKDEELKVKLEIIKKNMQDSRASA